MSDEESALRETPEHRIKNLEEALTLMGQSYTAERAEVERLEALVKMKDDENAELRHQLQIAQSTCRVEHLTVMTIKKTGDAGNPILCSTCAHAMCSKAGVDVTSCIMYEAR